jgi:putative selenate reductase FAD-binding subunit
MFRVSQYHRPKSIDEALQLLSRPDVKTTLLAGGVSLLVSSDYDIDQVVDLQGIGLDQIESAQGKIMIGAMVRLQRIVDNKEVPRLIREMTRFEGPNTIRHAGTLGGVVINADWESELFAALLVHEAKVRIRTQDGKEVVPLENFDKIVLGDGIVTGVIIKENGRTAHERVARTPADKPIVAAVGRKDDSGNIRLALCGVADRPILSSKDRIARLSPPGDFRGSSDYRQQISEVLVERVLNQLSG